MYFAITGIGWGRGETVDEAKAKYLAAQRRNFPSITDEELDEVWGFVWEAPEGATGFYIDLADLGVRWVDDDGNQVEGGRRVAPIGTVPEHAAPLDV